MKVELENGKIIIDGEEHEMPSDFLCKGRTIVIQTNNSLYVNGYEYCMGKWLMGADTQRVCGL